MTEAASEQRSAENETIRRIIAAAAIEAPGIDASVDPWACDGTLHLRCPTGVDIDPSLPGRIARRLREGRDFDPAMPADWHVRWSETTRRGDGEAGLSIGLSCTFRAPDGYSEAKS